MVIFFVLFIGLFLCFKSGLGLGEKETIVDKIMGNEKEEQYYHEKMEEIFIGHYQKAFIVFQNEKLMYYITEKHDGVEETTQSDGVLMDASLDREEESRFASLNLMMLSKELKDEKTLEELMLQYMKLNHVLDTNLKIL